MHESMPNELQTERVRQGVVSELVNRAGLTNGMATPVIETENLTK